MIEVLKQWLKALESMKETLAEHDEPTTFNEDEAITSLRQAIAELESQKPVGVVNINDEGDWYFLPLVSTDELLEGTKFYTHPPQRTEQNFCPRCGKRTADLTTIHTCTPPQD
jgi:hypothetical protein